LQNKRYKSSDIDRSPTELMHAVRNTFRPEIHKLINYIWNKEEMSQLWKKSTFVPIYKEGDKQTEITLEGYHCYQLHTNDLSNILLSRLIPNVDEIIGDHQREFRRNRPNTDQILDIRRILEKNWEYEGISTSFRTESITK
jgi:hypothetical protein